MDGNPKQGLVKDYGLTQAEHHAVMELAAACNADDDLSLPLNWGAVGEPPEGDRPDKLFYYERGAVIGFAGLQDGAEVEVYGMVHPAHRRKGIGRALFQAAQEEVRERGHAKLLLVVEEKSESGKAFAAAMGAQYCFAEYSMALDPAAVDRSRPRHPELQLRPASAEDAEVLVQLQAASFGDQEEEVRQSVAQGLRQPDRQYYIAGLHGKPIGSIRIGRYEDSADFTAFGVLPEYRGRGYGRQILLDCIDILLAEQWKRISIDVVTDNRNALGLYRSCGFRETTAYGYYHLDV
jgi:ribosomal protein S18 acetylase RimI-like enzyme